MNVVYVVVPCYVLGTSYVVVDTALSIGEFYGSIPLSQNKDVLHISLDPCAPAPKLRASPLTSKQIPSQSTYSSAHTPLRPTQDSPALSRVTKACL